jgi:pseudouridine-5'-phosphate glycosidase
MNIQYPEAFTISRFVVEALENDRPVVALESTVITHGLPYPQNLSIAQEMESEIKQCDVVPATIAVLDGKVHVGLSADELERLATEQHVHKISTRDYAAAIANKRSGGTTVAGTMLAANRVGIKVFATGGIGGVHRQISTRTGQLSADVSADLPQLASTPMIVVCAGAKAILNLPATLEYLESFAIPVVGFRTDEFPAFYSRSSGLGTSARADSTEEIIYIAKAHWDLGLQSAILVVNPLPEGEALADDQIETAIEEAVLEAEKSEISGQAVTPYLLSKVSKLTRGKSLKANLALLRYNARLAAQIALEL